MPADDLGRAAVEVDSSKRVPRRIRARILRNAPWWGAKIQVGAKIFEKWWTAVISSRRIGNADAPLEPTGKAISFSSMALYFLSASCPGAGSIACQIEAGDPRAALRAFLGGGDLARFLSAQRGWPKVFSEADIYAFLPVAGMTNVYQCELGRIGKYMSVTLARTVSRAEPKPDLSKWLTDIAAATPRKR
jgi:hypothetical protein